MLLRRSFTAREASFLAGGSTAEVVAGEADSSPATKTATNVMVTILLLNFIMELVLFSKIGLIIDLESCDVIDESFGALSK